MSMHRAFHLERQYVATNLCPCKSCTEANNLKLKFVAHSGEVATQTIRQRRKRGDRRHPRAPAAEEQGGRPEYVLVTEEIYRTGDTELPGPVHQVSQDLEGIGPVVAHDVDVADLVGTLPPLPKPSVLGTPAARRWSVAGAGLPYMVGLRRPRREAPAL